MSGSPQKALKTLLNLAFAKRLGSSFDLNNILSGTFSGTFCFAG